jgi:hypothetical protein
MWSAPGAWVVVKLAVLAGFALLLLLVLGELKTPEIRSVMALFSADVGRDNGGGR